MEESLKEKLDKVQILKDFTTVYIKSDKEEGIQEKMEIIAHLVTKVGKIQSKFEEMKPKFQYEAGERHTLLVNKWKQVQTIAMDIHILAEKKKAEMKPHSPLLSARKPLQQKSTPNRLAVPNGGQNLKTPVSVFKQNNMETPRMLLSAYKESPMVKKIRPIAICFDDFVYKISPNDFEQIPKYMKGRDTYSDLDAFFENTIVSVFNEKYQLLHRVKNFVKVPADVELWRTYNEQKSYFPGQHFITNEDIARKLKIKTLDKRTQNKIIMLKHLAILQEQRKQQLICYIWTASQFSSND